MMITPVQRLLLGQALPALAVRRMFLGQAPFAEVAALPQFGGGSSGSAGRGVNKRARKRLDDEALLLPTPALAQAQPDAGAALHAAPELPGEAARAARLARTARQLRQLKALHAAEMADDQEYDA